MKYCKRCVQPDTRPNVVFDEEGVCPPCRFVERRFEIDWDERREELAELVAYGKQNNHFGYDCIIGVSGGKDSTRQAMYAREELGLTPLLVCCTYPPEQITHRGAYNLANLIELGFDCISAGPSPQIWKRLMRHSFMTWGNWCKSTELALYACTPKLAIAYHIPIVFLGENPAITLGELGSRSFSADGNQMRHYNTLAGADPSVFFVDGISRKDLQLYCYPTDEELARAKVLIRYLGYYWPDFTKIDNASYSIANGLHVREGRRADLGALTQVQALDEDFVIVNQFIKHVKFGFGSVTDEVCEEIRYGRMTREEGIRLVKLYDGKCAPEYIDRFCSYLEISHETFWSVVESYRKPEIWHKNTRGEWELNVGLE